MGKELMKDVASIIPSKKVASVFLAVYVSLFIIGILGLLALPEEERAMRKIALFMSYIFGLPVVISTGLWVLRKIGLWNGK